MPLEWKAASPAGIGEIMQAQAHDATYFQHAVCIHDAVRPCGKAANWVEGASLSWRDPASRIFSILCVAALLLHRVPPFLERTHEAWDFFTMTQ
jgi:hypothetical protein